MLSEEKIKEISEQMPDGFLWSDGCGWETGILIQEAIDFTRAIEAECEKVPEGYVLVPKSPNWFFMFLKEWDHFKGMGNHWAAKFYEQLIATAPKPAQCNCQQGQVCPVCDPDLVPAQASPLDLMECLQDRPVEPSKAVQGKCVAQAEKQEPVAWVGCGDCDCEFPCYHGKTTCLRLPTEKDEPVGYMHPVAKKAISLADLNGQSEWIRAEWIKGAPLYATPFAKPSEVADAYTQGRNDGWEAAMLHKQEPVNYEPVARKIKYGSLVFLEGYHELPDGTLLYTRPQPDLTVEVERLKAERDSFYMDYRMKCDLETKQQAERIAALEAAAREARDALQYKLHVVEAILTLDAVLGNAEITGG